MNWCTQLTFSSDTKVICVSGSDTVTAPVSCDRVQVQQATASVVSKRVCWIILYACAYIV